MICKSDLLCLLLIEINLMPPHLLITRCSNEDLIDSEINTYAYIYKIQCPTYVLHVLNLFLLDGLNLLADVAYIQQHLPLPSPQPAVASCKRYVYCTRTRYIHICHMKLCQIRTYIYHSTIYMYLSICKRISISRFICVTSL